MPFFGRFQSHLCHRFHNLRHSFLEVLPKCHSSCLRCFWSKFVISCKCRSTQAHFHGKEVNLMEYVISFALSVAASVAAYYVCKWLDEQFFVNGKH